MWEQARAPPPERSAGPCEVIYRRTLSGNRLAPKKEGTMSQPKALRAIVSVGFVGALLAVTEAVALPPVVTTANGREEVI
jgi:hypothetical protein